MRVENHLDCVKIKAGACGIMHVYYGTESCTKDYVYNPDDDNEHDGHGHIRILPKGSVDYSRPLGAPHGAQNCHKRNRR